MEALAWDHQGPELFQTAELSEAPLRPKQYTPITGGGYNLGTQSTLATQFHVTQYCKNNIRSALASQIHLVNSIS